MLYNNLKTFHASMVRHCFWYWYWSHLLLPEFGLGCVSIRLPQHRHLDCDDFYSTSSKMVCFLLHFYTFLPLKIILIVSEIVTTSSFWATHALPLYHGSSTHAVSLQIPLWQQLDLQVRIHIYSIHILFWQFFCLPGTDFFQFASASPFSTKSSRRQCHRLSRRRKTISF